MKHATGASNLDPTMTNKGKWMDAGSQSKNANDVLISYASFSAS